MFETGEATQLHTTLSSYAETADRLAAASEQVIKRYYRTDLHIEKKSDHSPVTIADRLAEDAMREIIMREHPDHGILGEEFGGYQEDARFQWVLDPIDGTKSFISGTPLFGTLIALCDNGNPILGCINMPLLQQRFMGFAGSTTLNSRPVRMRKTENLREATVLVTDHIDVWRHKSGSAFDALAARAGTFRSWGDCYGYSLLASGYADVMIDPVLQPWDMYAIIPVMEGAGARITSYEGFDPLTSNSLVAAHPDLQADIIRMLNPGRTL